MDVEEYFLLTFYQKSKNAHPIMHAYGPYTRHLAGKHQRQMEDEWALEYGPKGPPGVTHTSVSKSIRVEDYNY